MENRCYQGGFQWEKCLEYIPCQLWMRWEKINNVGNLQPMGTTQSAYHCTMESLVDNSELRMEDNWMKIWRLRIPEKVKVFFWRATKGSLPTRHKLQTCGVHCSDRCVHCESSYENDWHVFFLMCKIWTSLECSMSMVYYTRELGNYGWFCSSILLAIKIPVS